MDVLEGRTYRVFWQLYENKEESEMALLLMTWGTGSMKLPLTEIRKLLGVADRKGEGKIWVQFTVNLIRTVSMEIKAAYSKVEKDERGGIKDSLCNTFNSFTVKKRKWMGQLEGKVVSRIFIHRIYKSMFVWWWGKPCCWQRREDALADKYRQICKATEV